MEIILSYDKEQHTFCYTNRVTFPIRALGDVKKISDGHERIMLMLSSHLAYLKNHIDRTQEPLSKYLSYSLGETITTELNLQLSEMNAAYSELLTIYTNIANLPDISADITEKDNQVEFNFTNKNAFNETSTFFQKCDDMVEKCRSAEDFFTRIHAIQQIRDLQIQLKKTPAYNDFHYYVNQVAKKDGKSKRWYFPVSEENIMDALENKEKTYSTYLLDEEVNCDEIFTKMSKENISELASELESVKLSSLTSKARSIFLTIKQEKIIKIETRLKDFDVPKITERMNHFSSCHLKTVDLECNIQNADCTEKEFIAECTHYFEELKNKKSSKYDDDAKSLIEEITQKVHEIENISTTLRETSLEELEVLEFKINQFPLLIKQNLDKLSEMAENIQLEYDKIAKTYINSLKNQLDNYKIKKKGRVEERDDEKNMQQSILDLIHVNRPIDSKGVKLQMYKDFQDKLNNGEVLSKSNLIYFLQLSISNTGRFGRKKSTTGAMIAKSLTQQQKQYLFNCSANQDTKEQELFRGRWTQSTLRSYLSKECEHDQFNYKIGRVPIKLASVLGSDSGLFSLAARHGERNARFEVAPG